MRVPSGYGCELRQHGAKDADGNKPRIQLILFGIKYRRHITDFLAGCRGTEVLTDRVSEMGLTRLDFCVSKQNRTHLICNLCFYSLESLFCVFLLFWCWVVWLIQSFFPFPITTGNRFRLSFANFFSNQFLKPCGPNEHPVVGVLRMQKLRGKKHGRSPGLSKIPSF